MSQFLFSLAYGKLGNSQTHERMNMLRRSVAAVIGREPTSNELYEGIRVEKYKRDQRKRPQYTWNGVLLEIVPKPKRKTEKCGAFCHDDDGDGLIICEEISGTEHSHHDGVHKCRKATQEEEMECRRLWAEDEENAVIHLKNGKVVDLDKS